MSRYIAIALVAGIAGLTAVACGMSSDELAGAGPGGINGGGASSGTGGGGEDDAGVDAEFGQDGATSGSYDYSDWCGGGCQPATEAESPCGMDGDGGSGPDPNGVGGGDCQLAVNEDEAVDGLCGEAGLADKGASCLNSSDCGPGLGCVQEAGQNVCRPYCCGSLEACPQSTYCALTPLASGDLPDGMGEAPMIPVCIPTTECTLLDDNTCEGDKTCTIVRVDGSTSCLSPGTSGAGQNCPCAAGHVCNTAKDECLELCEVGGNSHCPAGYTCQSGGQIYPSGFGVCVQQ